VLGVISQIVCTCGSSLNRLSRLEETPLPRTPREFSVTPIPLLDGSSLSAEPHARFPLSLFLSFFNQLPPLSTLFRLQKDPFLLWWRLRASKSPLQPWSTLSASTEFSERSFYLFWIFGARQFPPFRPRDFSSPLF